MSTLRNIALAVFIGVFALGISIPAISFAQDADTDDDTSTVQQVADLLARIQELRNQIEELQRQQGELRQELQEQFQLTRDLAVGMTGDDVEALQELLASDPELYPEGLVTGFFGPLTQRAVERLQERFGIDTVGRVGPLTRGTINRLFGSLNRGHGSLNRGPGNIFDFIIVDDLDDDDSATSTDDGRGRGRHKIEVCHLGVNTLRIAAPAWLAHQAHGDTLGECDDELDDDDADDDDEDDDTDEDDQEDAQEALDAAQAAIDEAQALLDDNEGHENADEAQELLDDAQEKLDEAEEAFDDEDYDEAEDLAEEAEDLADDAMDLLEEDDEDDEAPEIEDIDVDVVSSTSVTIEWDTDEDSDSTVWYSTEEGFATDADDTDMVDDDTLTQDHELELTDLDPDTTYYFIVGSEDEAGNEAMSEEQSFTTLSE